MTRPCWYCILLINVFLGSAKFIEPGVDSVEEEHDHDHLWAVERPGPSPGEHDQHIDLLHPVKTDPIKDGLWILKTKIDQLKIFESALKEKIKADHIHSEQKLHADLERLLHPKRPAPATAHHNYVRPPRQHTNHYPMGGYQHEAHHPFVPPPPPPPPQAPQAPYDPYYGY